MEVNPEFRDDGITAKIASLGSIQAIISRMATNSQTMKTWSITITTGFIAIKSTLGGMGCLTTLMPLIISLCFSFLDAYYLSQEKIFRDIYNNLSKLPVGNGTNFLSFSPLIGEAKKSDGNSVKYCYKSPSVIYFYLPLVIVSTMIMVKG